MKPLRILSFGAGVQSTTLLEMALRGDIEAVDHVIFADTGWEPDPVIENMVKYGERCSAAGVPFHVVANAQTNTSSNRCSKNSDNSLDSGKVKGQRSISSRR